MNPTTKCPWCNRKYTWDWEQDEFLGATCVRFVPKEGGWVHANTRDFKVDLYICNCGGSFAAVTYEPNGSTVFENNPLSERPPQ